MQINSFLGGKTVDFANSIQLLHLIMTKSNVIHRLQNFFSSEIVTLFSGIFIAVYFIFQILRNDKVGMLTLKVLNF